MEQSMHFIGQNLSELEILTAKTETYFQYCM